MFKPPALESLGVEEPLHRVHLNHRVADGRAGGERHSEASILLVEVTGFHVRVEGPFAAAGLAQAGRKHRNGSKPLIKLTRVKCILPSSGVSSRSQGLARQR